MRQRFESLVSRKLPVSIFGFWFCVIIVTKPQYEISVWSFTPARQKTLKNKQFDEFYDTSRCFLISVINAAVLVFASEEKN